MTINAIKIRFDLILNAIGYNICWFGLIFFGNDFIAITLIWLLIHLVMTENKFAEACYICMVAAIGISADVGLTLAQFYNFSSTSLVLPFWLYTLWFCFASTLNYSLSILRKSVPMQIAIGAFVAPLSYVAGAKFGAVELNLGLLVSYGCLAVIWALLFPLFFSLQPLVVRMVAKKFGELYD